MTYQYCDRISPMLRLFQSCSSWFSHDDNFLRRRKPATKTSSSRTTTRKKWRLLFWRHTIKPFRNVCGPWSTKILYVFASIQTGIVKENEDECWQYYNMDLKKPFQWSLLPWSVHPNLRAFQSKVIRETRAVFVPTCSMQLRTVRADSLERKND